MIKPAGFDAAKKYPVVVIVYGGPGAQYALNRWSGLTWDQVLAHKGFVVWQLDNRGSAGRGHQFESVLYHDMGPHELSDQKDGIQYLVSQGFVDPRRIGLYGWSYGGYMTLYTITHAPGLIKAAIAGAPVTNWRNYDTIYTERYMGLPEEDEEGYKRSAPVLSAAGLRATKLLMIHNVEDDNVHFQNSIQMAEALEKAGKQFFMLVYPQKTHNVSGPEYKQLLEAGNYRFLPENLKKTGSKVDVTLLSMGASRNNPRSSRRSANLWNANRRATLPPPFTASWPCLGHESVSDIAVSRLNPDGAFVCKFRLPGRSRRSRKRRLLALGHADTVWPIGTSTFGTMPFRRAQGRLWGPGVLDMKAGLAFLIFAMRALIELDIPVPNEVVLLVNPDEETGSKAFTRRHGGDGETMRMLSSDGNLEPGLGRESQDRAQGYRGASL